MNVLQIISRKQVNIYAFGKTLQFIAVNDHDKYDDFGSLVCI